MTFEDIDRAFTPPAGSDLVTFRAMPGALFATITSDAISSVEVQPIRKALHGALDQAPGKLRHLVLDLERVQFINSEAISVLLILHSSAKTRGGKLILMGVSEPVAAILVVSKLDEVLTVCMTQTQLEEALR